MQTSPQDPNNPAIAARVDLDQVRAVVEPVVQAQGLELVELELTGRVLRVIIDRPGAGAEPAAPKAGVTLDDCVHVSRDLSTALDVADLIESAYTLEVSSPGIDRPLKRPSDFQRSVGKLAKCKLVEPASDGQRVLRGTILSADERAVRMEVDGKTHEVAYTNIGEARLVIELGTPRTAAKKPPAGGKRATGAKPTKGARRKRKR